MKQNGVSKSLSTWSVLMTHVHLPVEMSAISIGNEYTLQGIKATKGVSKTLDLMVFLRCNIYQSCRYYLMKCLEMKRKVQYFVHISTLLQISKILCAQMGMGWWSISAMKIR